MKGGTRGPTERTRGGQEMEAFCPCKQCKAARKHTGRARSWVQAAKSSYRRRVRRLARLALRTNDD